MPDITNIPLVFTVVAQILGNLMYVLLIKKRVHGIKLAAITGLFFGIHTVLLELTKNMNPKFSLLYLLLAFLVLYSFIVITCRINYLSSAYCCVRGFMFGEFMAATEWFTYVWISRKFTIHSYVFEIIYMVFTYTLMFAIMYYLEELIQYDYDTMPVKWKDFVYTFAFAFAGFKLGNSVDINVEVTEATTVALYNTRALMSFGSVAILYASHALRRELYMKNEVDALQYVIHGQYEQYKQSKETTELVNMKYHDLKHQIALLKKETESEKRLDSLNKIEQDIKQYESKANTGNEVLDTILTEKKRYCLDRNIMFTCVADGKSLEFIEVMDLCSILGNALDNAIECENAVTDPSKRMIHMLIAEQKKFLLIKVDNYTDRDIEFKNGMPKTTKSDERFHGFGLKSMKYTVEKYGGMLTTGCTNQWFELNMIIPIPIEN